MSKKYEPNLFHKIQFFILLLIKVILMEMKYTSYVKHSSFSRCKQKLANLMGYFSNFFINISKKYEPNLFHKIQFLILLLIKVVLMEMRYTSYVKHSSFLWVQTETCKFDGVLFNVISLYCTIE